MTTGALDQAGATPCAAADACGKINLTLDVHGRRADGFHNLRSLAIGVGLADRVRVRAEPGTGVSLRCSEPALEWPGNLVVRAADAFHGTYGHPCGLSIDLVKRIPAGAGMGGGSSDAAATLRLCDHLFSTALDRPALARLGATLGSDVPLFFHLPAAVLTGRGEHVEPVALRWSGWVLLVFVGAGVSTAEVYRGWRPSDAGAMPAGVDEQAAQAPTAEALSAQLTNHLEPAVFRVAPTVARAHETLRGLGYGRVRVSGAGSALFLLFDEKEAAQHAADEINGCDSIEVETRIVAAPVGESPLVSEES